MIYYNNIIELKLTKNIEVTQKDLTNLDKATEAYEDEIRPYLAINELVELDFIEQKIKMQN